MYVLTQLNAFLNSHNWKVLIKLEIRYFLFYYPGFIFRKEIVPEEINVFVILRSYYNVAFALLFVCFVLIFLSTEDSSYIMWYEKNYTYL